MWGYRHYETPGDKANISGFILDFATKYIVILKAPSISSLSWHKTDKCYEKQELFFRHPPKTTVQEQILIYWTQVLIMTYQSGWEKSITL